MFGFLNRKKEREIEAAENDHQLVRRMLAKLERDGDLTDAEGDKLDGALKRLGRDTAQDLGVAAEIFRLERQAKQIPAIHAKLSENSAAQNALVADNTSRDREFRAAMHRSFANGAQLQHDLQSARSAETKVKQLRYQHNLAGNAAVAFTPTSAIIVLSSDTRERAIAVYERQCGEIREAGRGKPDHVVADQLAELQASHAADLSRIDARDEAVRAAGLEVIRIEDDGTRSSQLNPDKFKFIPAVGQTPADMQRLIEILRRQFANDRRRVGPVGEVFVQPA